MLDYASGKATTLRTNFTTERDSTHSAENSASGAPRSPIGTLQSPDQGFLAETEGVEPSELVRVLHFSSVVRDGRQSRNVRRLRRRGEIRWRRIPQLDQVVSDGLGLDPANRLAVALAILTRCEVTHSDFDQAEIDATWREAIPNRVADFVAEKSE